MSENIETLGHLDLELNIVSIGCGFICIYVLNVLIGVVSSLVSAE